MLSHKQLQSLTLSSSLDLICQILQNTSCGEAQYLNLHQAAVFPACVWLCVVYYKRSDVRLPKVKDWNPPLLSCIPMCSNDATAWWALHTCRRQCALAPSRQIYHHHLTKLVPWCCPHLGSSNVTHFTIYYIHIPYVDRVIWFQYVIMPCFPALHFREQVCP